MQPPTQTTQRPTVATLLALLLGFGLMQMGNTLQATLLSVRGGSEGFSPAQIGAVGSGFWVGVVIGSLRCGKVIQIVGHIRAFVALGAIASTAPLLHLLLIDPLAWVLTRALTGFCFAGLFIVVESWLNSAATEETRGQILSIYAMTGLLAGIVGQLLLPATDPAGFRAFCIVAIIIAFALVPIALTRASAPAYEGGGARISIRGLYRQSPFGIVAAFLCGVATSAFFTLGPVFAQRRDLDTGGVAVFMASGTLGGFLMAWPLGWLSDRLDRRLVIIGAAVTATASLLTMMALVPDEASRWILYLCAGVLGGDDRADLQRCHGPCERRRRRGRVCSRLRRPPDHAGPRRGGWTLTWRACHVGVATRPVIYAHCNADRHRCIWGIPADTESSSARDAQRSFRSRAPYPSRDRARVGTFESRLALTNTQAVAAASMADLRHFTHWLNSNKGTKSLTGP